MINLIMISHSLLFSQCAGQVEISWNFVKFLIIDGQPVKRYSQSKSPKTIEKDIVLFLDDNDESEL